MALICHFQFPFSRASCSSHFFFIRIAYFFCPLAAISRSKSSLWTPNYLANQDFVLKYLMVKETGHEVLMSEVNEWHRQTQTLTKKKKNHSIPPPPPPFTTAMKTVKSCYLSVGSVVRWMGGKMVPDSVERGCVVPWQRDVSVSRPVTTSFCSSGFRWGYIKCSISVLCLWTGKKLNTCACVEEW
jgi:hypothetical protein